MTLVSVIWSEKAEDAFITSSDLETETLLIKFQTDYVKSTKKALKRAKESLRLYMEKTNFWQKLKIVFLLDSRFNYLHSRMKEILRDEVCDEGFRKDLEQLLTEKFSMKKHGDSVRESRYSLTQ